MKSILSLLMFGFLSAPCSGEIVFDWKPVKEVVDRKGIENIVKTAALKYTESKYADKGYYNFITSKEKVTVTFHNNHGIYTSSRVILLEQQLLAKPIRLLFQAFHEFSHAYDHVMLYHGCFKTNEKLLLETESRATMKEHLFLPEIRKRVPPNVYQKLMECYIKGDYYGAYYERAQYLDEWNCH